MPQYISGRPSFQPKDILGKESRKELIFPLNQERLYFFFSARYALASGLEALALKPGDAVLVPAYNCGVEIDPILHLGIKAVFYKIGKDLLVDFDDLSNRITEKVKAILVTHFLGFPQPIDEIKEFCVKKGMYLIEDCAHGLLSSHDGKPLGSYGDVSIFSLLKTLPVPNGGLLVINNKDISYNYSPQKPNIFATSYYAAELLKYRTKGIGHPIRENSLAFLSNAVYLLLSITRLMLVGFRKYLNPNGLYLVKPDSYLFIKGVRSWGISGISRRLLDGADFEKIRTTRRKDFEYLLAHFVKNERGMLPFRELAPGVCPLFFPIILENSSRRDRLYRILKSRGIVTHPWWDRFHPEVPWDEFPDAVYLKSRLFGLPIHQDLGPKQLDLIIEEFERAYKRL